uniref:Uncharacterized protein n=1 Tax=Roseihalotalea indica TaxID=2867963 RepID=A0AA49JJ34_9BACT|nr:hypothetical protein K4G66_05900 [Tunicatimonas sp. TK19036]
MLTDDEKARIKAEEVYREEIKKSLADKKQDSNPFWVFLNSGLGLWFLSTIVIGLFTYLFNEYKEDKRTNAEQESKIKQLDLEIESRISQFWVHIEPLIKRDERNYIDSTYSLREGVSYDTLSILWDAFKNPPSFNPKLMTTIYREYDTRTTISLMIELATVLEQKYGLTKNHHVGLEGEIRFSKEEFMHRQEIDNIESAAISIGGNGIFSERHPTVKEIWIYFNGNIIVHRWDKLFPYTDCLFC